MYKLFNAVGWCTAKIKKGAQLSYSVCLNIWRAFIFSKRFANGHTLRVHAEFTDTYYESQGDVDLANQINKGPGVNMDAFKASNINGLMLGWRPDQFKVDGFEAVPYANINKTIHKGAMGRFHDIFYKYDKKEKFYYDIEINTKTGNATFYLYKRNTGDDSDMYQWNYKVSEFQFDKKIFKGWFVRLRLILWWIGGRDTDGNGLGGPAPKDLVVSSKLQWLSNHDAHYDNNGYGRLYQKIEYHEPV